MSRSVSQITPDAPMPAPYSGTPDDAPTGHDLLLLGILAVAVRLVYVLVTSRLRGIPLDQYSLYGDSDQFMAYAHKLVGLPAETTEYHMRLFPGLPLLMGLLHRAGVPIGLAGLLLTWIGAAFAAPLAAAFFRSRRIGMALVFLVPDYLLVSTVIGTEPIMLALVLGGFLAMRSGRLSTGALLVGAAGVVRPMACFAMAGFLIWLLSQKEWRKAAIAAAVSAAVVGLALLMLHLEFGDALRGFKAYRDQPEAYNGEVFAWPFKSILFTPLYSHVSPFKLVLVWAHLLPILAGCGILVRRLAARKAGDLDWVSAPWLLGNTLFVICAGNVWGFHCLARFMIPGLPPLLRALDRWLPRTWLGWAPLGAASFALSVAIFVRRGAGM